MSEDELDFRPGVSPWVNLPPDEKFLSMIVWRDMLLVATDRGVYRMKNKKLYRAQIAGPSEIAGMTGPFKP